MTAPLSDAEKKRLEAGGYVVLRRKSHEHTLRELDRARSELRWERERAEDSDRWARNCLEGERRIAERLTFVWGIAISRGATAAELAADPLTREPRSR